MALEQRKVWEIVRHSVGREVDIPEFQRPFVWEPEQVRLLAESLHRDYPVGSFLLWDSAEYQQTKTAAGTEANLWIVDGQQRTTALCILLGRKPYWWADAKSWNDTLKRYDVMVNILSERGGSVEFGLPSKERDKDPHWLSLREVLGKEKVEDLTPLAQRVAGKVASETGQVERDIFTAVHANIQGLWQVRQIDIPVVKISHEVEDVAEIFARLNREGTLIKEADVVLALAAVRNPGWVRDDYLPFRMELEEKGWELEAGIFIRTMTGIGQGKARLKEVSKDFWSPPPFGNVWKQTREAISEVLTRLAVFGVLTPDLVLSNNSLIPLFVAHHLWKSRADYRFESLFRWFLLANRDGRYGGAAISNLDEDAQAIYKSDSFPKLMETLRRRLRVSETVLDEEYFNRYDRAAGSAFLRLMLYLSLRERGAKDWVDKNLLGYDKSGTLPAGGYAPQWHHIFPVSMLKRHGVNEDDIHFFGNITILNEHTNVRKLKAKWPTKYVQEYAVSPDELKGHAIPDRFATASASDEFEAVWSSSAYGDFVLDRSTEIAKAVNEFLDRIK